ncbi:MAG TPA: hypothetical protein VFK06_05055 [Candidatus Angelobacter sp.]|nr:hypothetical protein [Candidatus Angelobacter sp.]
MKYLRALMFGTALMIGSSVWTAAQGVVVQAGFYGDRDDRVAFDEGYRQGRWDAEHRRRRDWDDNRWREGDDRRAYREGYNRGYDEAFRFDGRYRDGFAQNIARDNGFRDGFNHGLRDRETGHSFRPTHDGDFRHADRGYDPRFGFINNYRQVYRDAYLNGYERGYNGGGGYRR